MWFLPIKRFDEVFRNADSTSRKKIFTLGAKVALKRFHLVTAFSQAANFAAKEKIKRIRQNNFEHNKSVPWKNKSRLLYRDLGSR